MKRCRTSGCRTSDEQLIGLLLGSLAADRAIGLKRHLESCADCTERYGRLLGVQQNLAAVADDELPEVNFRQVEAQVRWRLAQQPKPKRWRRSLIFAALAATSAACALFAFKLVLISKGDPAPTNQQHAVAAVAPRARVVPREIAALPTLLTGQVSVLGIDGTLQPLSLNRPVLKGEKVIVAEGAVALQWAEGSGLRLERHTAMLFAEFDEQTQLFGLERGKSTFVVAPRKHGQRFAVRTNGLEVSVKGTVFAVESGAGHTSVDVSEGVVAVRNLRGAAWDQVGLPPAYPARPEGDSIDVVAGYRLSVRHQGHPPIFSAQIARRSTDAQAAATNLQPWPNIYRMLAGTGALLISSNPSGIDLTIDDTAIGKSNVLARSGLGRKLIGYWRNGKLLRRRWVTVTEGPPHRVAETLLRPPARRLPAGLSHLFRQRAGEIRTCYERRLKRQPKLAGRLTLRVAIDKSGDVSQAEVVRDSLGDALVARCATTVIARWKFPPQADDTILVYPFVFRPQ